MSEPSPHARTAVMAEKSLSDSVADTDNTGTVAQTGDPNAPPTVVPHFSLASAPAYSPSEAAPTDGTLAAPASYNPDAVSKAAAGPSIVYSEGPTGTVVGPSAILGDGPTFGRTDPPAANRYTVLKEHAKGGMGQVSVAVDEELDREVALKEIQPRYAYDRTVAARFLLEARVTGRLEHPGIVPVYGLNRHPDGRPYYAMRFITGQSLQDALKAFHAADEPGRDARERALAMRQLLTRFVDVCNTIAYSHSRGILHRDLKPANVMLGGFGETLVVDWGLAKDTTAAAAKRANDATQVIPALAQERAVPPKPTEGDDDNGTKTRVQERPLMSIAGPAATDSGELTELGKAMGTPAFMAPEQADGRWDDVGLLADIYSLGATLYAVLTGKAPFRGDTQEILDRVKRGDMIPIFELKPATPPALAAVCHKAMALRPQDRYATALDLAADVERWMADEPLTVYREPWHARLLRWARRHRNLVFGSAAVLLTALVTITVGYFQVHAEQKRTSDAKLEVEKANVDLRDEQKKVTAAKLLAEASREDARDALLTLTDDAVGEILTTQHTATGRQRQFLEGVIRLYERFIKDAPDAAESRLFVAGAHFRVGRLQTRLGQHDQAAASYAEVLKRAEGQTGPDWTLLRGETHLYGGILSMAVRQLAEAEKQLTEAHAIFLAAMQNKPQDPKTWHRLGQAQDRLGLLLFNQRRLDEAEEWFRYALDNRRQLAKLVPTDPEYQYRVAQSLRQLGMVANATGNRLQAIEYAIEARRTCLSVLDTDLTSPVYLVLLADIDGVLSIATAGSDAQPTQPFAKVRRKQQAAQTEAAWYARNAVLTLSQLVRLYPADVGYRHQLATANLNLSIAENLAGRWKAAVDALRATTTVLDDLDRIVPDHPFTVMLRGRAYHAEAVQQRDQGEPTKALAAAEKAVQVADSLVTKFPDNAGYLNDLGCYQIELAAALLQTEPIDHVRAEDLLGRAWANTIKSAMKPGTVLGDPLFRANVRSFGRLSVDVLIVKKRPDTVESIAKQITELNQQPDAERFDAAAVFGRAAMRTADIDPDSAKKFVALGLAKLAELEDRFAWLQAMRTDPDLEAVRRTPAYAELIRDIREPAPGPRVNP